MDMKNIFAKITKERIKVLSGFCVSLFVLWKAVLPIQILYAFVLLIVMLFTRGKPKFFLSLLVTVMLALFCMPQILRVSHFAIGKVMSILAVTPELVYENKQTENLESAPLISIVIPAYNYEDFVIKAIESAATQDIDVPYEVVVVDDASTDKTLMNAVETAKKFSNVRVYSNKKNQGLITTKNSGIALARGKWIFNLDADDYISENALKSYYDMVTDHQADMVFSWHEKVGEAQGVDKLCNGYILNSQNCISNFILYSKQDWLKYGGYSYLFSKGLEDWAFHLNFAEDNKRIVGTKQIVCYYFIKNKSRNTRIEHAYSTLWWTIQEYFSSKYGFDVRFLLFLTGFDKGRVGPLNDILYLNEMQNFRSIPKYEVY